MSTRMLNFAALLGAYAAVSLYLADDRAHVALYGVPILLVAVVAAVRRWNSPYPIVLAGAACLVPAGLASVDVRDPVELALSAAQLIMVALYGLALVVDRSPDDHDVAAEPDERAPLPVGRARSVVALELRRSRRTRTPLSLLFLGGMEALEPPARRDLVESLTGRLREFDVLFTASADELGILCVDTDRAGARRFAERLRAMSGRALDCSIVCFPDDAVTVPGLFDPARRGAREGEVPPQPVVVADRPTSRRPSPEALP